MKITKCLCLVIATLSITFAYGDSDDAASRICLLRAPRSGSHWFFYCCNTLFGKNICKETGTILDKYPIKDGGNLFIAHNPYDLHLDENNDRLILLIRNYRECMLREFDTPESVKKEILCQAECNALADDRSWVLNLRKNHYFHNLRVYEHWHPEKRMIVYYEDLLLNPESVLRQVAEFIGEKEKEQTIQAFIDNLDEHIENSLGIYEQTYHSHTRGKSLLYHTHRVGLEASYEIDQLVIEYFPDLVDKYLTRYLLYP
ncbi:MAG: sulfotransferase domain-containing protein [Chlamydiales bacterium]|nr:sulfotransferase domain-containing protein [Chlamydiia bacterium]MCP5506809.1 sulfotransferase domain-containing protein [Chlamydiales bacterium]